MKVTLEIINHLKQDIILSPIVDEISIVIHDNQKTVFEILTKSIVSQQLSTSAAATIYGRFLGLLGEDNVLPEMVLAQSIESLRSVGLSFAKAQYVRNVAEYFKETNRSEELWYSMSDAEIIQSLTTIKGVGKWTVEMLLIFGMQREDVLPLDDLIIKNTMLSLYGINPKDKNAVQYLNEVADNWRPYRSYACRYLWAGKNLIITKKPKK